MDGKFECPQCGALYEQSDTYCKKCLKKFSSDDKTVESAIEGINDADVKRFIGKNSDYYLKMFKKAGNKKYFFQLNWHALIFGQNWMFYRKMYLYAMLTYILVTVCSIILVIPLSIARKPLEEKVEAPRAAVQAYEDEYRNALNSRGSYYDIEYDKEIFDKQVERISEKYDIKTNKFKKFVYEATIGLINLLCGLVPLAFQVLVRLLSNALYKQYIIKNIRTESGGTSVVSVVAGHFIINALDLLLSLLPIPVISTIAYVVTLIK